MTELQTAIAASMLAGITAEWGERQVGYCWRQIRRSLVKAGVPREKLPPQGYDAAEAFEFFQKKGWVRPTLMNSIPGDIVFWVGKGHGKHGHVGGRVQGNRLAENSSYHWNGGDGDARGFRDIRQLIAVSGVVRIDLAEELRGA